jgi:hypothetical protein
MNCQVAGKAQGCQVAGADGRTGQDPGLVLAGGALGPRNVEEFWLTTVDCITKE